MTGNKATGVDELPVELIKAAGEAAITALTTLCRHMEKQFVAPRVEISIFTSTEKRRPQTVFQLQNHCIDPSCK